MDLSGRRSQHTFSTEWFVVSYPRLSDAIRTPTVSDLHVSAVLSVTAADGSSEGQVGEERGCGMPSIRLLSEGWDRDTVIRWLDDQVSVPTGLLTLTPTEDHIVSAGKWHVNSSQSSPE